MKDAPKVYSIVPEWVKAQVNVDNLLQLFSWLMKKKKKLLESYACAKAKGRWVPSHLVT